MFSFTPDYNYYINADKVIKRGSGYAIKTVNGKEQYGKDTELALEIEHIYPDYSIYPHLTKDTAFGFLTRGCPRGCTFCHVAAKEGKLSRKVANLSEFWNGQKNIVLCDPNILACKDWRNLLQQLIDSKATVDFNQGLDVRLMTAEKAEMLGQIKMKNVHFAWDRYNEKETVLHGLKQYSEHARLKPSPHNCMVYTLVNYDTTIEQDLERIYTLRDIGYWAYVMVYNKSHADQIYKDMQRWVNNRILFGSCRRFEDYKKYNRQVSKELTLF